MWHMGLWSSSVEPAVGLLDAACRLVYAFLRLRRAAVARGPAPLRPHGRFTPEQDLRCLMRIGLAQVNTTVGDLAGNRRRLLEAAAQAGREGAELVVFPEMALTSYPPRDLLLRRSFINAQLGALDELASNMGDITAVVGFVSRNETGEGKPLRNSAAVLRGGRVTDVRHKTLLPTYDVFDERRYFEPAGDNEPVTIGGRRVGLTICEDAWAPYSGPGAPGCRHDPLKALAQRGIDLAINISASPFTLGKPAVRAGLLSGHARSCGAPLVYVNQVGGNDELVFDGDSQAYAADGTRRIWGALFEEDLIVFDVDDLPAPRRAGPPPEIETVHRAVVLGIRDFVRKCGFSQVVLGLSGGVDSSVTAALAAEALGPENATGISMPSVYSSPASREDAAKLAANLGIDLEVIPLGPAFDALKAMLSRHLTDRRAADITEQNIQARIRGLLVMALANRHGWLAIATGNKSELATGYCTLYGDMCGALAPLGDILKTQVYALAQHVNRRRHVIPDRAIGRPPSAELRPNQTDQDSLPAYDVLDGILEAYLEQERGLEEVIEMGFERDVVLDVVRRIGASEHKRRQAPPCLKVTSRAFGHGRRLPIARKIL